MDNSKQEKEINDLSDFNSRLIERIGLFYLPSWKNISKYEFYKKDDGYIIKKIYDMQSNVSYRSATMILYKQFDIFKPVISQIEVATFCFLKKIILQPVLH